ncbi:hypothetical protein J437_LFUL011655 [Ladona fulva]|uniref:Uncharacterized protein n=1 Tax=Ladona fulva TaxID=123851 RepID=A0A8K0KBV5_LADFU|nr:hypothetical protein J437_LFUL011655 [Ladona fulva]
MNGDPYVISKHRTRVTCLEVISVLDERKEASNGEQLHYVISTSHDGRVKVSYLIKEGMSPKVFDLCQHNCSTVCIRVQQSYFAILDSNGTITVWMVDPPKEKGIMPTVHLVANYPHRAGSTVVSLDIWGGMVTAMTKYGTILNADFYESKDVLTIVHSPQDHTVHVTVVGKNIYYLTQVNYHNEIGIAKCYTWRNQFFLWITDAKKILISLDGQSYFEYDTNEVLKSYPKSALIYGNILLLGMESGSLYMYYFDNPHELLNLDLNMYHWYHPIASSSILAMEICEESSGPMLAVLCKSNIYFIEWTVTFDDIVGKEFPLNPLFV